MDFCVLIKVSRRSVAFWYQTDSKRFAPLAIRGVHEVPLYFYVDNNQFNFGQHARDRFYAHDPYAFGNYFEIIKDPSRHFVLHDSPRRVKQMLYYGIEQYLSHFLNTVLYKSDSIESYRPNFPIKFIFEPDLQDPERDLIAHMFTEAGYQMVSVISYPDTLVEHLRPGGLISHGQAALLLNGLDDTLYLDLYLKEAENATDKICLAGQGSDPRIRILAGMIIDYIKSQNPYLDFDTDDEINAMLPYCSALLTNSKTIITGDVDLTNGSQFWFRINLRNLEDRLQFYQSDMIVSASIYDLLHKSRISPTDVVILLCSDQIKTNYFVEQLLKQYPNVISVTSFHHDEVMQTIFNKAQPIAVKAQIKAVPTQLPDRPKQVNPPKLPPLPPQKTQLTAPQQTLNHVPKPPANERPKTILPPPLPPSKKKT